MIGNFADAWEAIAAKHPDDAALLHAGRRISWGTFDARASGLAGTLADAGLRRGDRVVQYLHSGPEYLESVFAAFKARLVPVNTNYRYRDDELVYLWENAGAAAVIFDAAFAEIVERLRARLPGVRAWVCVTGEADQCPPWAVDYADAVAASRPEFGPRSGDDLYLLYTGGTTGLPRGVMWRQCDLMGYLTTSSPTAPGRRPELDIDPGTGSLHLSASPLMHGTGSFTAFQALCAGGCVATLAGRSFVAEELLDVVRQERVQTMALVGDAFCRPILTALAEHPGRWALDSLRWIVSSGAIWSADVKAALLEHNPSMILIDSLGSSEAPGMASSIASASEPVRTGVFHAGPATVLVDEHGYPMASGTGTPGLVAVTGHLPLGYHNDPRKTAATFMERDGRRYSIPGDWATLDGDGTLHLLGRGASCINTGGEKVFAEEVETALRSHDAIDDAVVVGIPDDRLGQRIVAVVEAAAPQRPSTESLIAHVKSRLAAYKAPKELVYVDEIPRTPSGKVDYQRVRAATGGDSAQCADEESRAR